MVCFFIFLFFFKFNLNSNEYYLKTEDYLEKLLVEKNGLEIAKIYYFLHKDKIALEYLHSSKDDDYLTKAKLYAKLGQKGKAIESSKKYIYNKKFDYKFNYFEELKETLKLIGIDEEIKNLGKFEEIVISYIDSNNFEKIFTIFPKRRGDIIQILLSQRNIKYNQELLIFNESSLDGIACYLFNNIKNFYDREGYFRYFDFLEKELVVKLKTVLEEIMYYFYKDDMEQATFIFNKELEKSRTSLEKYMLYMLIQKDFEENFEFPSDKHFYLYIKELKKRESKELLKFLDLFLKKYKESNYLNKIFELKLEFSTDKVKFLDEILEKSFSDKLFDKKLQLLAKEGKIEEYKTSLEQLIKKFPIPKYVKMLKDLKNTVSSDLNENNQNGKSFQEEYSNGYKKEYDEAINSFNNSYYERCFKILDSIIDDTIDYKLINLYLKVCHKLNLKNRIVAINKKYSRIIDWYER